MEAAFTRELRLGVVMYGGASLAVYENGIAQELFRAAKGEGIYAVIQHLIDSQIYVDIMSGTSAGGINGILLAYALANNKQFRATARLWRKQADILKLLRKPGDPNKLSLFDSEGYFQSALEHAMANMPDYGGNRYGSEIDLFVTGTHVQGQIRISTDALGQTIPIKDHRALFVLSYRGERKNEFARGNVPALATLARITSCFPVAFAPVHTSGKDPTGRLLHRWGRLDTNADFLDGGILDNKPFSPLIDAISRRISGRRSDRLLLFMEPDPDRIPRRETHNPPTALRAAAKALFEIPRYRSIRCAWEAIAKHNQAVAHWQDLREALGDIRTRPGHAQWRTYLRARRADNCGEIDFRWRRLIHTSSAIQSSPEAFQAHAGILAALKEHFEVLEMIQFSIQTGKTEWTPLPSPGLLTRGTGTLLNHSDRRERSILRTLPPGNPVREEYRRFIFLGAHLFPMESLGGLTSKEFIRTIRFSPPDPGKVGGRKLGHFGAFFKESVRAQDLLQGRLDGSAQLIQSILLPARARGIAFPREMVQGFIRAAHQEIMTEEAPSPSYTGVRVFAVAWRAAFALLKVLWGSLARLTLT